MPLQHASFPATNGTIVLSPHRTTHRTCTCTSQFIFPAIPQSRVSCRPVLYHCTPAGDDYKFDKTQDFRLGTTHPFDTGSSMYATTSSAYGGRAREARMEGPLLQTAMRRLQECPQDAPGLGPIQQPAASLPGQFRKTAEAKHDPLLMTVQLARARPGALADTLTGLPLPHHQKCRLDMVGGISWAHAVK